jgi:hypothetical protein
VWLKQLEWLPCKHEALNSNNGPAKKEKERKEMAVPDSRKVIKTPCSEPWAEIINNNTIIIVRLGGEFQNS